jgi:GNAT superfamily N-acetyltransferase
VIRFSPQKPVPVKPPRIFVGDMTAKYRSRVRDILVATKVFREDEIDVAIELFDEVFGTPLAVERTSTAFFNDAPVSSDYFFLGAFTPEEELAGFACYGPTPATDRTYDLYWIAVHPSAQGSGCGTILLNEVERRLKGLNARLLVVETSSRSDYKNTRGSTSGVGMSSRRERAISTRPPMIGSLSQNACKAAPHLDGKRMEWCHNE